MKSNIYLQKENLRKEISKQKKQYTRQDLLDKSEVVFCVLEITGFFNDAKHILIYNALQGEVATLPFIEKWKHEKSFYLPVVTDNKIQFCAFNAGMEFKKSCLGIDEPLGETLKEYHHIDMVIVPGIAFDRSSNRLGRGKGHYDQFLSSIKAPKVGVCFDFQLLDKIPTEPHDIKMDMIVSENDLIW